MLIVNDNLIDFNIDKRFETLAELYKAFFPFRVAIERLHKTHDGFMQHIDSDCYVRWNDEAVEFCKGILYTAFCLGYIDDYNYSHFSCVLCRYKSFYYK